MRYKEIDINIKAIPDKEDEAFYFHQLVEWIQDGNNLPLEGSEMEKALGL